MRLAGRQMKTCRIAQRIARRMDFSGQPALAAPDAFRFPAPLLPRLSADGLGRWWSRSSRIHCRRLPPDATFAPARVARMDHAEVPRISQADLIRQSQRGSGTTLLPRIAGYPWPCHRRGPLVLAEHP
jgi:hypothetical protein